MRLDASNLPALARGCAILGAGGGGDTHFGLLMSLQAVKEYGPVPVVDLDDLPDDALLMPCGGVGAPTVSIEKIENGGRACAFARRSSDSGTVRSWRSVAAEIGGSNGLIPAVWAAHAASPWSTPTGWAARFPRCRR